MGLRVPGVALDISPGGSVWVVTSYDESEVCTLLPSAEPFVRVVKQKAALNRTAWNRPQIPADCFPLPSSRADHTRGGVSGRYGQKVDFYDAEFLVLSRTSGFPINDEGLTQPKALFFCFDSFFSFFLCLA